MVHVSTCIADVTRDYILGSMGCVLAGIKLVMRPLVENDACHGKAASIESSSKISKLRPKCYPINVCVSRRFYQENYPHLQGEST